MAIAITAMALLGAAAPAPAAAAGSDVLKQLRRAGCPPDYRPGGLKSDFTQADIDDALENDAYTIAGARTILTPPVDWSQDPIGSQTFRASLASLNWTQVLFAAHLQGDSAQQALALHKAAALILDWIRNQQQRGPATTPEAWGTKRAGDRLTLISYLARVGACERTLSRAEAGKLLASVLVHTRYIERHRSSNNHGLFDAYALAVAAQQLPFMKQAQHWRNLGVRRFESILRNRIVPEEGIWLDHSTTYHFGVVSLLQGLLDLPKTGDASLRRLRTRMEQASAWLVEKPDGARLQWGDSSNKRAPGEFVAGAEDLHGLETMRRSGLAFVREGDSYLAALASYHNRVHKHSDELSFGLFDRGHQVVSDTGDYERDDGPWRDFSTSPYAHSTLTVDGQNWPRSDHAAYGTGIIATGSGPSASGGSWYAIRGRNPLVTDQGVGHQRWLLYKPGVLLVVVDRVRAAASHTYTRYFHLGPDINQVPRIPFGLHLSAGSFQGTLIDRSPTQSELHMIRDRPETAPAGEPFAADPGGLQGHTSPGFFQAIPRWTAAFNTATGDDEDYVASFGLDASSMRAELIGTPGSDRIQLQLRTGLGSPGTAAGEIEIERNDRELKITETP